MTRQLAALQAALAGVSSLLILPHTNPDPDAIASAVALRWLVERQCGIPARIAYQGVIGRAENQALVSYLRRPLRRLRPGELRQPVAFALVDTQPGAGNCAVAGTDRVRVVIDHHPAQVPVPDAPFVDIRPALGATATILTEYLQASGMPLPRDLATALFYGIKTDTLGLVREVAQADVQAYLFLQPQIDRGALLEIEQAQVPMAYFRQLYAAVQAAQVYDDVVIVQVGELPYPDLTAELADLLLRLKGVQWSVCVGVYERQLLFSVRTRRRRGGAGRLAQQVVGAEGTAGGHGMLAGGQLPLQQGTAPDSGQMVIQRVLACLQKTATRGVSLVP